MTHGVTPGPGVTPCLFFETNSLFLETNSLPPSGSLVGHVGSSLALPSPTSSELCSELGNAPTVVFGFE